MSTIADDGKSGCRAVRLLMATALVGLCLGLLSACATTGIKGTDPDASAKNRPDLVTASDEAPARRRARIRLELASSYFEAGKPTFALDEIKQSLKADPTYADAYNVRALIYMRLNDFALADESFRRALELDPRDPDTLHNRGWLLCQQQRYAEADALFSKAETQPGYTQQAKTLMAQGICDVRAGRKSEAEVALKKSYDIDPGNPLTGYTLANLLREQDDYKRAQFYIRRVNNGEFSTAESLWLGMKIDHKLGDTTAVDQLGEQLRKRFSGSPQRASYDRGAFNE
jgi:type IV pilus assembly protein PilF